MFKEYIKPLIVLTAIALVFSGALAFVNSMTAPVIEAAGEERTFESMYGIIPEATGFVPIDFAQNMNDSIKEAYRTENGVGYIFIAAAKGYSGDITVMCAIGDDGKIIAAQALSHTETQGIGTVVDQESFLAPFAGADSHLTGIDTVTGATISTRAFIRAIDDIFAAYDSIRFNLE